MVTETPEIYRSKIRPFIQRKRDEGRLNWVFNILDGRTEQEDVILRDEGTSNKETGIQNDDGFLLLPDLNWDRKTVTSLHLLGLVVRRDIWSLRDLKKEHVEWLSKSTLLPLALKDFVGHRLGRATRKADCTRIQRPCEPKWWMLS